MCTLEAVAALIHELENDDHTYDEMLRACQIKVGRVVPPVHMAKAVCVSRCTCLAASQATVPDRPVSVSVDNALN